MEKSIKTSSTVDTQSNDENSSHSKRMRSYGYLAIVGLFYLIVYAIFYML
jgi:hypothetical protein